MAKKKKIPLDLGFGTRLTKSGDRLIRKDGSINIIRNGSISGNAYQALIAMSDRRFTFTIFTFFTTINAFFAYLFILVGIEQLNGVPEGSWISDFLYAFFFSIQTFTTVGYGGINPVGISANFVASLCASIGLIAFAIITGLLFARFSRPRSHIAFSEKALITPYLDTKSFQCRIVNTLDHKIINLSAQITMTWLEEKEGSPRRKFAMLPLERSKITLFPINWTLVHSIDAKSPLRGMSLNDMKERQIEILVMVTGFDESYSQTIHADSSYIASEIVYGLRFKSMYTSNSDGPTILNIDDLNAMEEI
ncbi:MAG: ion channel [Bacteroidota bacterium]